MGLHTWDKILPNPKKMKEIKKYQLPVTKIIMGMYVKYSIGTMVNNIVITMYDVRWLLDISR